MKYIFLNLKRFDIPTELGGVNRIADIHNLGSTVVSQTQVMRYTDSTFAMFFSEAQISDAVKSKTENSPIEIGCQSVYREDTAIGGNFGAFTSNRTANAAKALGCTWAIIGHCEERRDKAGILAEANVVDTDAINRILNKEIKCALAAGLKVLYCIGETSEEQSTKEEVLGKQLSIGLQDVNLDDVVIAYEPIWAIGPGKTPPEKEYIQNMAKFIKSKTNGTPVVYGGGLKTDNAKMLASIKEIDGGLIALTRFSGEIGFYPDEYLEIIAKYMDVD